MDKKRAATSDAGSPSHLPPPKQYRTSDDVAPAPSVNPSSSASPSTALPASSTTPAAPDGDGHESLITFQRSQLAAKISEQNRDIAWLRSKVDELQKLVAVLDAAPRAALYHMCAVREDLTLTLARLGLTGELDHATCPIAATMLDAEVVTNESLGEMPAALKRLVAQIVIAFESKLQTDPAIHQANEDLHRRLRQVSDQLERYAEREKQSLVSSTTFRDEYDDLREEASIQRRKIVALDLRFRELNENRTGISAKQEAILTPDASNVAVKTEGTIKAVSDPSSNHASSQNGELQAAEAQARELSQKRLEELKELHEENKSLISELEGLRAEVARRDANVVPIKAILSTALYQTMEATLQQLYLKERTWQLERDGQNEEREAERKDAEEHLEAVKTASEKTIDHLRRQMEDLRRIAEAAKVEKDKVVLTYEARKMEAGNAAPVIAAAERRAKVSEDMRDKLSKSNAGLTKEVEALRKQVTKYESEVAKNSSVSAVLSPRSRAPLLVIMCWNDEFRYSDKTRITTVT